MTCQNEAHVALDNNCQGKMCVFLADVKATYSNFNVTSCGAYNMSIFPSIVSSTGVYNVSVNLSDFLGFKGNTLLFIFVQFESKLHTCHIF